MHKEWVEGRSTSIQEEGWIDEQQVESKGKKCAGWMIDWLKFPLLE